MSASDRSRQVLDTLGLVRQGQIYSLAYERFRGMPVFPGHPQFEVLSYRTPQGIRAAGDQPWGPCNDAGLGYMSEVIFGTAHTGAHIDAHAHMTIGEDDHWYGGSAQHDLGDFGPLRGDASEFEPIWARGVLYDVPRHRGSTFLGKGESVGVDEIRAIGAANGIGDPQTGDIVLIRTGYLSHWPDPERMAAHRGPGPDVSVADWLVECGVYATGSDTETYEVQPVPDPGVPSNPQPVHTRLLIENGIFIMEGLNLEEIGRNQITEFLFIALPVKIRGATGSMIDPVAVV
jgi:kynurenine formamidase